MTLMNCNLVKILSHSYKIEVMLTYTNTRVTKLWSHDHIHNII